MCYVAISFDNIHFKFIVETDYSVQRRGGVSYLFNIFLFYDILVDVVMIFVLEKQNCDDSQASVILSLKKKTTKIQVEEHFIKRQTKRL